MMKGRCDPVMVAALRKVLTSTTPKRLKLSPGTVMELMKISRPGEVEVVELGKEKKTKHIAFNGTPIILSLKLSHNQHRK